METKETIYEGIGVGSLIAVFVSYNAWHHLGWLILHGILGWIYIIYYLIKYGVVI